MDPADMNAATAQKGAGLDAESANYQTVVAALDLMRTKLDTAKATARESQADADAMAATAARAQADLARAGELVKQKTISAQEYDAASAASKEAAANLNSAPGKRLTLTSLALRRPIRN